MCDTLGTYLRSHSVAPKTATPSTTVCVGWVVHTVSTGDGQRVPVFVKLAKTFVAPPPILVRWRDFDGSAGDIHTPCLHLQHLRLPVDIEIRGCRGCSWDDQTRRRKIKRAEVLVRDRGNASGKSRRALGSQLQMSYIVVYSAWRLGHALIKYGRIIQTDETPCRINFCD